MGGLSLILNELTSWEVAGMALIVVGYLVIDVIFTIRHCNYVKEILSE